MKSLFASAEFGLVGLLLFFAFFTAMLVWLFIPGTKDKFKGYGHIPLKDDHDE